MRRFFFQVLVDRLTATVWRVVERKVGVDVAVAEAVIDHESRRAVLQYQQELAAAGDAEAAAAVGEVLKTFDRPGVLPPLGADPAPSPALPAAPAAQPSPDKTQRPRPQKKALPPVPPTGPFAPPPQY